MKKRIAALILGAALVGTNLSPVIAEENTGFFSPEESSSDENLSGESSSEEGFTKGSEFISEEENLEFTDLPDESDADNGEEFSDEENVEKDVSADEKDIQIPPDAVEAVLTAAEGSDITLELNQLLELMGERATDEKPCRVIIPPGNYQLTGTLHMYSNLTLYAEGAVIVKTSTNKHILLRLGKETMSRGGYDGYRNITIEGGTWDCNYMNVEGKENPGGFVGFRIGHVQNVTVKNVTFLNNLKSHFLEFAGAKDVLVTGCTFRGYWPDYEAGGQECIQIDSCLDYIFPGYEPFDGATCENIVIERNTFVDVFAGVGSHSMVYDRPFRNIVIRENTFRNIRKRAVWCLNYVDSVVENNIMENVGGGVLVSSMFLFNTHLAPDQSPGVSGNHYAANLTVKGNQISISDTSVINGSSWRGYGIMVQGVKADSQEKDIPADVYKETQVTVEGNAITGSGNGIRLYLAENCQVRSNQVKLSRTSGYSNMGIYLAGSSDNVISDNLVYGCRNVGIYLFDGGKKLSISSRKNQILHNLISDTGGDGILIEAGSTGSVIDQNQVKSGKKNGILIRNSKGCQITSNQVFGCALDGIYLDNTGNATIKSNKVTDGKGRGLVLTKVTTRSLYRNQMTGNKRCGLYVKNSKISGCKKNTLESNGSTYAIYVSKSTGLQSVKLPASAKVTKKTKIVTGTAAGGKNLTIYAVRKNGSSRIGKGKVDSEKKYAVSIKKQKKGTRLRLALSDKYGNVSYSSVKVR